MIGKNRDSLTVRTAVFLLSQDAPAPDAPTFSTEELEQIVAPIALHPDDVVAQILMASTYPLEVVQAQRWQQENASLQGDALAEALEQQTWDPSVKSLVQFPEVLKMMSDKLDWTQKLGDAVLADQAAVMAAVQTLRQRAKDAGNLETTEQQNVVVEDETIIIVQADPEVIYVPTYNTTVVYGTWPYAAYPPYYYPPPSYYRPGGAAVGFLTGVAVGVAWGYAWGDCRWHGGDIDIDIDKNVNLNRNIDRDRYNERHRDAGGKWNHDPTHRKGARYRDDRTAAQYGRETRGGRSARPDQGYRGHTDRAGGPDARDRAGRGGSRPTGAGATSSRSRSQPSAFGSSATRSSRSSTNRYSSRGRSSRGRSSYGGRSGGRSGGGRRGGRR
jgi:hypothetical protein